MSTNEIRERIKTRIWKAIAKSDIHLEEISKDDLDSLVEVVTEAAMLEFDSDIDLSIEGDAEAKNRFYPTDDVGEEQVLWQGKPFLSISEHYLITSERIRIVRGILGKNRQDIELIRVQDIDQTQTLRERTLNLGDITIHSHDRDAPVVVLNNVHEPEKVQNILRQAVQNIRKQHKLTFQEEM